MSCCYTFGTIIKQVDPFASSVSPTFAGGTSAVTSWLGTCTSFVLILFLITYAQTKL